MSCFIPNSFQVPNAVVDEFLRKMSGAGIKCYLLITRQTTGWQKQKDRISIAQFMEKCGIKDKRTAQNGVAELEELGLIIAFRHLGEITEFMLNFEFENTENEPVAKNVPSSKNSTKPVAKNVPSTGYKKCTSTKDTIKNNKNNTLTGINAHTHETKKSSVLVLLEQFGITGKLAEDFIVHRKAKKAPITETALNGYQREADKAKIPIQKAVEIAIERGWTGFKADWQWQDDQPKQHRPKDNMGAEWNTPEAWAEVL